MGKAIADFALSDVTRLITTIVLLIGTLALLVLGKPVPDQLYDLDIIVVTFYFAVGMRQSRGSIG